MGKTQVKIEEVKQDLTKHVGYTAVQFMKVEQRIENVEKETAKIPRILEMLDNITKIVHDIRDEQVLMASWLKKQNQRIKTIEGKIA